MQHFGAVDCLLWSVSVSLLSSASLLGQIYACAHPPSQTLIALLPLQERVERAGGQVLYWNGHRVMGVLAMSRAIGDHGLRPYVIPEPEVIDGTAFSSAWYL